MNTPLAERIRPKTLDDYLSQQHLIGPEGALTQQLNTGVLSSLILWGPPGTGKTRTISAIIETLIARTDDETPAKILACAPSNVAVDNLVKLMAGTKINKS